MKNKNGGKMKSLKSIMTFLVSCCVIFSLAFTASKEGSEKELGREKCVNRTTDSREMG